MKLVIDLDDFRKNRFYTILKAYIKENPGCNVNEIAYATGFSYCMCRNRINDMEIAGIVNIKRLDNGNPHSWVEGITLNESNGRN